MARYRVGLIGCGSIGRAHAYGWTNNERTELVALADIIPAARDEFGEELGVEERKRYADFREMMAQEKPDIVSVCLWHGQHAPTVVALAAMQPKLILCEKPMATSLGEAEQMIVLSDSSKFRNRGSLVLCPLERIHTLITDDGIETATHKMLTDAGINVIIAHPMQTASVA